MTERDELRITKPTERRTIRRHFPSFSSLLDDFFEDFFTEPFIGERERTLSPKVDLIDKPDKFILKAEIPGVEKKDLNIEVGDDYVVIKGEKKKSEEHKEEDYYYKETYSGKFIREVSLPERIKTDTAKATYENGILNIELPKAEESKARKLEVG
jgi:HSP20 family protein